MSTIDDANIKNLTGPSIEVKKYVSVDNGATYVHADAPPGPFLPSGVIPRFKFVVTNNGDKTLEDIVLTDTVFGLVATVENLDPGEIFIKYEIGY